MPPTRKKFYRSSERRGFWRLWLPVCKKHGWPNSREKRHALYFRALGYDKNQREFGHAEWDLVFAELRRNLAGFVSEGPEALRGVAAAGAARRQITAIERLAPEAYIAAIAHDKFPVHANWRNLSPQQLDQLRITVIERVRAKKRAQPGAQAPGLTPSEASGHPDTAGTDPERSEGLKSPINGHSGQIIADEMVGSIADDYYAE